MNANQSKITLTFNDDMIKTAIMYYLKCNLQLHIDMESFKIITDDMIKTAIMYYLKYNLQLHTDMESIEIITRLENWSVQVKASCYI